MGSKSILENKSSLSTLISPVSPPTSACSDNFSGFHLPPVTTRIIYPYSHFSGRKGSFSRHSTTTNGRRFRRCDTLLSHGILGAFFWFALGTFITVLGIFIAKNAFHWDFLSIPKKLEQHNNNNNDHHRCTTNNDIKRTGKSDFPNGSSVNDASTTPKDHISVLNNGQHETDNTNDESLENKTGKTGGKCSSPACMTAASRILHRINLNHNPCDDFYQFSCGNFIAHNEIPDDSFQRSTLQEMQESILVDIKSKSLTLSLR